MVRKLLTIVLISFNIIVMVNCVIPTCYQCNSEVDDDCKIITSGESDKYLDECITDGTPGDDVCYTLIDGLNVKRNCLLDETSLTFVDDCVDNLNCEMCNVNGCNKENKTPLECIKCNSDVNSDCVTMETIPTPPTQCADASEQCYVGIKDGHTERGCITNANCDAYPNNLCKSCTKSDGCNDEIYPSNRLKCLQCEEELDGDCALTPTILEHSATCQIYDVDDFCFTIIDEDRTVSRGCSSDKPDFDFDDCESDEFCQHCADDDCNENHDVGVLSCNICKSDSEPNCASLDSSDSFVEPCDEYSEKCFDGIDSEGIIHRGCTSISECDSYPDGKCEICSNEDGCNNKEYVIENLKCIICKSSTDLNCVSLEVEPSIVDACDNVDDQCFVGVSSTGETIRGCITDTEFATYPNGNAERCSDKDACNENIFPEDRLQCLKCESTDTSCSSLATVATHSAICENYKQDDSCFTTVTGDTNAVARGCISDEDAETKCSDSDTCVRCDSKNCNNLKLKSEPELSCIQCDQEDPKCEWGFANDDAVPCTTADYLEGQELCYTYQNEDEIKRGCVLDDNTCMAEDETCDTCSGDGCNNVHIAESTCFICDTENTDEAFCGSAITGEDYEVCSDGNSAYGYRGCYTEKIDERVHRGCVSTLTNEELLNCENTANLDCVICYDTGCNNKEPNFASRLYYLSTLTLIFISLLAKLINSNVN